MKIYNTDAISETWPQSRTEREWLYNGLDNCVTLEVLGHLLPQLDNISMSTYSFERDMQGPVLDINMRGIRVDFDARDRALAEYMEIVRRVEAHLDRIIREGVGSTTANWRSPDQLKDLLYTVMGFPEQKFHSRVAVRRDALEKLAQSYFMAEPIVSHILCLRDIWKKVTTLKTRVDSDGRIRTSVNISGTNTGRFSSSFSEFEEGGSNLQNVEERLRRVFISDLGKKFAYIDLEQAESRAVGAICWNKFRMPSYLNACESGDLHTYVTKMVNPSLPWPADLAGQKALAETPFYRQHSYRHQAKVLGHGCLTEDHEVLTPEGWVSIATKPSIIMSWSETQSTFTQVQNWTDQLYNGWLQSFEGNSISALMTHDHRVPYINKEGESVKARAARLGPQGKLPLGSNYIGGELDCPARLIAAFMADGSQNGDLASFHLRKERKIKRLQELCHAEGYEYILYRNADGSVKLNIKAQWPKHPGAFMFQWNTRSLIDFIDEYKYWDGHIGSTSVSLFSHRKEDLEWIQTFGRLLGIGGSFQKSHLSGFGSIIHTLQQNHRKWAAGSSLTHTQFQVSERRVLCPTVSSSWFYVRRHGKIFVTGNSNYMGQPPQMHVHTHFPIADIQEFQRRYFAAFPEIPIWHQWVKDTVWRDGYLINLTGRRRWFFGRRNDPEVQRSAVAFDPQGSVANILNQGMLQVWRLRLADLLLQVHDAILVQYEEDREDEILPKLLKEIVVPIELEGGRTLVIPSEAKVGWNWANATPDNPDGLAKYKGHDKRSRTENTEASIVDRLVRSIS